MGPDRELKHVVVTPVKNESDFLPELILSMARQTVTPFAWVFVDDGSTDGSPTIISDAVDEFPWISLVSTGGNRTRRRGAQIAKLFNIGIDYCGTDWDFCSKIDADMILEPEYFEEIFRRFENNGDLGIASGNCYVYKNGSKKIELVEKDHARGGLKTYKRECFTEIGGVMEIDGWDGIDNIIAQMNGWSTRNFLEIMVEHRRPTGHHDGIVINCFKSGRTSHIMGYTWTYQIAKSILQMSKWPPLIGGFSMLLGFFSAKLMMEKRIDDKHFLKFLRKKQRARIIRALKWKS